MTIRGLRAQVRAALEEDRFREDRTTRALLPHTLRAEARVLAQARGTLSGIEAARAAAAIAGLSVARSRPDGDSLRPGRVVLVLRGDARRILAAERTILNYLMHLSGVATATARAVRRVRGARPPLQIWGTRKTQPGLRDLEKAAIVHGGGQPHRRDLSESVLIKSNHLSLVRLDTAIARARQRRRRGDRIAVEVRSAREALQAARSGADGLLIDNASPRRSRGIVRALERTGLRRRVWVELSGGITPETAGRYRKVGADALSLGSLTHSASALPFHLRLAAPRRPPP